MDDVRTFRDDSVGLCIEDLAVGMSAAYARTVTETDIILFAGVSGDNNAVHMNEIYAQSTIFKGRIVHGLLSASFVSAVIGSKLPGPGARHRHGRDDRKEPGSAQNRVQRRRQGGD